MGKTTNPAYNVNKQAGTLVQALAPKFDRGMPAWLGGEIDSIVQCQDGRPYTGSASSGDWTRSELKRWLQIGVFLSIEVCCASRASQGGPGQNEPASQDQGAPTFSHIPRTFRLVSSSFPVRAAV